MTNESGILSFGAYVPRLRLARKAIAAAKDPKFMHRLVGQAYREITHDVEMASQHKIIPDLNI